MEIKQKFFNLLLLAPLICAPALAFADCGSCQPLLNKISLQVSDERWASTQIAKVTVSVDAALDKVGLANINAHVLENLNKIANSPDWHVVQFNRSLDKSGLEVVHIEAEARLAQNFLANLRDKAKNLSKPGETYTLANIDFTPSLMEMEKTHAEARAAIYNAAKQEVTRLNQVYPEQHYFIYSIDFAPAMPIPPSPAPMLAKMMVASAGVENAASPPSMPINAKVVESASVVVASLTPTK